MESGEQASGDSAIARALALDLRSLAAFRVGLGALLLYDLANRALDLSDHYTDAGVLPLTNVPVESEFASPYLSLHLLSGSFAWQASLFALAALVALALLVGWRTRLMTGLSFLLLGSLHARNPLICYEADALLAALLLWALFLPLGAVASLDARGQPPPEDLSRTSMAGTALILQVGFMYWFAALNKTGGPWWDGTAVAYALQVDQYVTPLGKAIRDVGWLTAALTWGTLVLEGPVPLLLLSPWRSAVCRLLGVASLLSLQLGFFLTMDLGIFPATSSLALIPLLPSAVWDRFRGPDRPPREEPWSWRSSVVAGLLVACLAWNAWIVGDREKRKRAAPPLLTVLQALRLDQSWAMFAPEPMTEDGWFVISAQLSDETLVDLFNHTDPLSWEKPASPSRAFGRDRWKEWYMTCVEKPPWAGHWERTTQRLADRWAAEHPQRPVTSLSVVFVQELTLPPGTTTAPPQRLYQWSGRPR